MCELFHLVCRRDGDRGGLENIVDDVSDDVHLPSCVVVPGVVFHELSIQLVPWAEQPGFHLVVFNVIARVGGVCAVYLWPPVGGHEHRCLDSGFWLGDVSDLHFASFTDSLKEVLIPVEGWLEHECGWDLCGGRQLGALWWGRGRMRVWRGGAAWAAAGLGEG